MSATVTVDIAFPTGFEHLQAHQGWVLATERERIEARLTTAYDAERRFYDDVVAVLPEIMAYLKTRPIDSDDPKDLTLLRLTQSFLEIANAVELYGEPEIPDGANLRLYNSVLDQP